MARLMTSPAKGRGPRLHSQRGEPAPGQSFPGKIQPNLQCGAHGSPLPFLILHQGSWIQLPLLPCPLQPICGSSLPGPGSWALGCHAWLQAGSYLAHSQLPAL